MLRSYLWVIEDWKPHGEKKKSGHWCGRLTGFARYVEAQKELDNEQPKGRRRIRKYVRI